ncbi:hypothetical protein [Edaphobacter modestus]|uniref:Uncharacterized protein n=1 Tax=Edaphobacter modestus TaxID=388466 RepID=A0A4Q7XZI5_9BACT|nr:hypothetical protein [Edaphobacter modestus]RZU29810.1 hypothetical protein BDD14_6443 [Edaphobacter modestus]
MGRQIKWRHEIHTIASSVRNSQTETWTRRDIERVFCVSRGSAQTIMRAVGEIQDLGGKHVVSRASLLSYLDVLITADDLGLEHRARLNTSLPVPRVRLLKMQVPDDLRTVMVRDLPPEITLEPGRIEICGANSVVLMERLLALALALQNDLDTAAQILDPPRHTPELIDNELSKMFRELAEREKNFDLSAAAY